MKPTAKTTQIIKTTNSYITLRFYDGKRRKTVRIGGWWKVDSKNRLKFYFTEAQDVLGSKRSFIFYGSWFVNRDNYLVYEYESPSGRERIVLKGRFVAFEDKAIVYRLERTDTFLKVRAELLGRLNFGDDKIRYRIFVEGRQKRQSAIVSIGGRWEVLPKKGALSFAVRYGDGKIRAVEFRIAKFAKDGRRIYAALKAGRRKGIELGFGKKDWRMFVETVGGKDEAKVGLGIKGTF